MMSFSDLPSLNATLNLLSATFLVTGYVLIRRRQIQLHKYCMLGAVLSSGLFLVSYLVYHYQVGSRPFEGTGWIRPIYFSILITHTILAAAVVPLVLVTLRRALAGEFVRHRTLARWTLPIWIYVSATGVFVYLMLYQFYG